MHPTLLVVHSLVRWLVLAVALYAVGRMARGLSTSGTWTEADRKAGVFFTIAFDIQLLLGILLFGISPVTRQGMADMAGAMKDPSVRFFIVEHPALMVIAVAVAHVASILARRGPTDRVKFVRATVGFGISLAMILAGIPWWRLRAA